MYTIRRPRSVIRKFDPNQPYWIGAKIFLYKHLRCELVTYWKNPEIDGIWEFRYRLTARCMRKLWHGNIITEIWKECSDDAVVYTLVEKYKPQLE